MNKPDSEHAPEVQSRENAIDSRTVDQELFIGLDSAGPDSHDSLIAQTLSKTTLADYGFDSSDRRHISASREVGNVPPMPSVESQSVEVSRTHARDVTKRLQAEGRWFGQAEATRDELMASCKGRMTKEAAQAWTYSELDRLYPPPAPEPREPNTIFGLDNVSPYVPTKPSTDAQVDAGSIQGLSDLPGDWPTLPSNASLSVELGWVQANRLRIVEERPGKATLVRLDRAASPAPSLAALGWLETSIRSYAKYVDVAAKASGGDDEGESAVMKRERKSVDEARALLQEMQEAEGTCSRCGRPY